MNLLPCFPFQLDVLGLSLNLLFVFTSGSSRGQVFNKPCYSQQKSLRQHLARVGVECREKPIRSKKGKLINLAPRPINLGGGGKDAYDQIHGHIDLDLNVVEDGTIIDLNELPSVHARP